MEVHCAAALGQAGFQTLTSMYAFCTRELTPLAHYHYKVSVHSLVRDRAMGPPGILAQLLHNVCFCDCRKDPWTTLHCCQIGRPSSLSWAALEGLGGLDPAQPL